MLGPLRLRHFPLFLDLVRLHGFASVSGLRAELRNEQSGFVLVPFVLTPQSAHHRFRPWTQASAASAKEVRRNKGKAESARRFSCTDGVFCSTWTGLPANYASVGPFVSSLCLFTTVRTLSASHEPFPPPPHQCGGMRRV
jgi:hypothetical protein